jgi:hypothetical protein
VTKGGLDAGLKFANQLFLALENMGHGVVIAAAHERFSRDAINEHEDGKSRGYNNLWSPGRCTLAYSKANWPACERCFLRSTRWRDF